jgi:hypothetical protein
MDNLNLNNDEAIIHKTQTIIINGVRYEALLTSRRLILVERETGGIHDDIPFAEIGLAISGVNKLREPVITLIINSPNGEKRTIELIFIRLTGNQNIVDLEKCIAILKEHYVPIEAKSQLAGPALLRTGERTNTGELVVEEQSSRPAVPDWTIHGTSRQGRRPLPVEAPQKSPLTIIAAVVLIIVVFAGGALIVGQVMNATNVPVHQNATGSYIANNVVSSPPPTPTPQPQGKSGTGSIPPPISVPTNGVWVQISYPGNFSGFIGAQGRNIEVNSSGSQFYQLCVQNTMIDGSIEKMDGSAGKLEVEIYNGGTLISHSETQKPGGVIDIHVTVGPAIGNSAVTTPSQPQEIRVSPYASLPQVSIPPSGVWVRVFYPGNFIGSIGANGQLKEVNGTGDQFYQLPITNGMIEGSIGKQDGTVNILIIVVYKDGALVSQSYTSAPRGVVDIHTRV